MAPNTSYFDINRHKKSKNELKRLFVRTCCGHDAIAGLAAEPGQQACLSCTCQANANNIIFWSWRWGSFTAQRPKTLGKKNMQKQSIYDPKLQLQPRIKAKQLITRHVATSVSDSFTHGINPTLDGASFISMNLDNTQTTSIMMQQRGIKHKWKLYRNANAGTHKHLECSSSAQLNVDAIRKKKKLRKLQNFQEDQIRGVGKKNCQHDDTKLYCLNVNVETLKVFYQQDRNHPEQG